MRGTADGDTPQPYAITGIAWAPSCGRSYHLVATGGRDGHVRIWRVKPPALEDGGETDGTEGPDAQWSAVVVADFDDHKCVLHVREVRSLTAPCRSGVGRVEWNVTGWVVIPLGARWARQHC